MQETIDKERNKE